MVMNVTEISQKMKSKSLEKAKNLEKNIIESKKYFMKITKKYFNL